MPRYLIVARLIMIGFGYVFLASSPVYMMRGDRRTALLGLVLGTFFVIPHRKILKTRLAPVWVALGFVQSGVSVVTFCVALWSSHYDKVSAINLAVVATVMVIAVGNAEYARRSFSAHHANERA